MDGYWQRTKPAEELSQPVDCAFLGQLERPDLFARANSKQRLTVHVDALPIRCFVSGTTVLRTTVLGTSTGMAPRYLPRVSCRGGHLQAR